MIFKPVTCKPVNPETWRLRLENRPLTCNKFLAWHLLHGKHGQGLQPEMANVRSQQVHFPSKPDLCEFVTASPLRQSNQIFRLLRQTGRYPRFSLLNPFGKSVSSSSLAKLWIAYGSTALTSTDQYPSYLRHTITIRGKTKRFCTLNRGNHRNLHRGRHVELKSSTCICHQSVNSVPVLSLFRSISSAGFAIFWTA